MNISKLSVFLLFLVITPTYAQLCSGTKVILLDSIDYNVEPNWQLVFDEEFMGDTLDLGQWELTVNQQGALDGTGPYNTLDNVKVSPEKFSGYSTSATGVCSIIAKRETVTRPPVSWNPSIAPVTYQYTSSNFNTKQKFGWGKYEIRCKIPKGKGFWSAFWLYSEVNGEGHEIDIFEFANGTSFFKEYDPKRQCKDIMMNYHSADNNPGNRVDHDCACTHKTDVDFSLDYHTYSVIWNRFGVSWYVDGEYIKTAAQWYDIRGEAITPQNIKPAQVVFRNDWYPRNDMAIIVDLDIESKKGVPDETTPFPSSFDIDYIRYYSY